jgi:hypothetical protein
LSNVAVRRWLNRPEFPGGSILGNNVLDRDGLVSNERASAAVSDWTMDVRQVIADQDGLALDAIMDIRFTKDTPPESPPKLR